MYSHREPRNQRISNYKKRNERVKKINKKKIKQYKQNHGWNKI